MPSQTSEIVVQGMSSAVDPVEALRLALGEAAKAMAGYGATPGDILAMMWTARRPAAIHPSRVVVDLTLREIFGGIRPSIKLRFANHDGVRVELQLRQPIPAPADPVWGGLSMSELARAYSPRSTVSDMGAIFDAWRHEGAAFRDAHLTAELAYGPSHGETLDLYLPDAATGADPLWLFIHGGYWQAVDKAHNAHFAAGMLKAGYAVAMLNYTLAPIASLAEVLVQTQRAIAFLSREAGALGCNPGEIHISGHSAGGHLVAMIAALPEGKLIRSCLPLSGIFDIEPLARLPMGRMLRLDDTNEIDRLSPQNFKPLPNVRIGVAVGGKESSEFQRQSTDYAAHCGNAPCRIVSGKNHFDLLDGLNGGELLDFALEIAATGHSPI